MDAEVIVDLLKDDNIKSLLLKDKDEIKIQRAILRSYDIVDVIAGFEREESARILESLKEKGLVKKVKMGNYVVCPYCKSINIHESYLCPFCKSDNLEKIYMVQHLECGQTFSTNDLHIDTCPRCGGKINGLSDIRLIGGLFKCLDCGEYFELPEIKYKCMDCQMEFSVKEAMIKSIESYELTPDAKIVLRIMQGYKVIAKILEELGFEIDIPGVIKGESGIIHEFPLVVRSNVDGKIYTIDVTGLYEEFTPEYILKIFPKIVDTPDAKHFMIVSKKYNNTNVIKLLPKRSNFEVIEAEDIEEAGEKIKIVLREGISS